MSRRPLHVLSRHEITAWGWTRLGLDTRSRYRKPDGTWGAIVDHGRAMFVELGTEAILGERVVVWILDLPSDPSRHRIGLAAGAASAIASWAPSETSGRGNGAFGVAPAGWAEGAGFPQPDVVVGDLNIPRGSRSIDLIAPGFANAQRWARPGWHFSWPRGVPVLHIDHVLVAPGWIARGYRLVDPGVGLHEVQRVEVGPITR